MTKNVFTKTIAILFISITLFGCDAAKQILAEANRDDRKIERQEEKKQTSQNLPPEKKLPKPKEERKIADVPLSGKLDPDGLPVSNNTEMAKLEETSFPDVFNIGNDVTVRHKGLSEKNYKK
jgi:hypothetical protein